MDFKILFVVLMAYIANMQNGVDAAGGVAMATAVVDGADKLTNVMERVNNMVVKPILQTIDDEVKKIETNIAGVKEEEKKLVYDAIMNIELGKNDVRRLRAVLKILASETITRASSIQNILARTQDFSGSKVRLGIKMMAKKMKQLLERSKDLLKQALTVYQGVNDKSTVAKVKLTLFAKRIDELASESSKAHKAAVEKVRTQAYAAAAAGLLLGPLGLVVSYSAAAAVVESKIKAWKKKAKALQDQCKRTKGNVLDAKAKVTAMGTTLTTEERLVREWDSHVNILYSDFENADDYVEFLDWDESIKTENIQKLINLKGACQAYLNHVDSTPV